MNRFPRVGFLALLGVGLAAGFVYAETIELVTYYPSSATTGDLHVTSLTVGTAYNGVTPPDGVAAIYDKLWIGQGYTNPDRDPAALRVVGYPGAADKVLFLPGAGGGTLNVGIGTAAPITGLHVRSGPWPNNQPAAGIVVEPAAANLSPSIQFLTSNRRFRGALGVATGAAGHYSMDSQVGDVVLRSGPGRLLFATDTGDEALPNLTNTYPARMAITNTGNVGIGTTEPADSAVVEMASTTQGFLPPRMTTAQRQAIAAPVAGLVVYDTTMGALMFFNNGGQWQAVGGGAGAPIGTNLRPARRPFRRAGWSAMGRG